MDFQNVTFTESGSISATVDGQFVPFPASPGNRYYNEMVRQGITPAPYVAPTPTIADVKVEAHRRIIALAPEWQQLNLLRDNPSDPVFTAIDLIRTKSDALEALYPNIPADYATNDAYWGA